MADTAQRSGDKRGGQRRPIRKRVEIATGLGPNQQSYMRDVSAGGARLAAAHGWSVPDIFLCVLGPDLARWCEVVWRSDREVGVQFVQIPASLTAREQAAE
jgi:hypothetical protein